MTHFLSRDFAVQRDFTQRWYPDPLAVDISNPLCDYCAAIEFDKLPGEEEDGLSHQPSYRALKQSAETCALCTLLCDALREIRNTIDVRLRGSSAGGAIEYQPSIEVPDGTVVMGHFLMGTIEPGTSESGDYRQPRAPDPSKPGFPFEGDESVRPWLFGNWYLPRKGPGPLQLIGLGVRLGKGPGLLQAEGNGTHSRYESGEIKPNAHFPGTYLRIRAEDAGATIADIVPGRLRATHSESEFSFGRLELWLNRCDKHHGASCGSWSLLNAELPTRVLDVDTDSNMIYLVEPKGQKGAYITLSHRWGGHSVITTIGSTLAARMEGIGLNQLPKTFLDAVKICRRLKVRYLWIDSLCIVQDSPEDWAREAARMADVYANSYLTIAASSSQNSREGCFPDWEKRSEAQQLSPETRSSGMPFIANAAPVRLTDKDSRSTTWLAMNQHVYVNVSRLGQDSRLVIHGEWMPSSSRGQPRRFFIGGFGRRFDPLSEETLNTRGWTLQERLLSPRTIHYATEQMFWECERELVGEDGAVFDPTAFSLNTVVARQLVPTSEHGFSGHGFVSAIEGLAPARMKSPGGRWRGGWLAHVEAYSQRNLTVATDKLPAMAGLAAQIAAKTGDEYYAGLWGRHMVEDLCWRMYTHEEILDGVEEAEMDHAGWAMATESFGARRMRKLCDVKGIKPTRAPSWSWAALDGFLRFVPLDFTRLVAQFLSCEVDLAGASRFGSVTGGRLKIAGPLFKMSRASGDRKPGVADALGLGAPVEISLGDGVSPGEAFFDTGPSFPCHALFLDSSNALVLRDTGFGRGHREFSRVGIARFLRTERQRKEQPLIRAETLRRHPATITQLADSGLPMPPWGPVTRDIAKTTVVLI